MFIPFTREIARPLILIYKIHLNKKRFLQITFEQNFICRANSLCFVIDKTREEFLYLLKDYYLEGVRNRTLLFILHSQNQIFNICIKFHFFKKHYFASYVCNERIKLKLEK